MIYVHVVVDPQLSPAGLADHFPGLADSPSFASFPGQADSLELEDFLDLVDFLQEAPVDYLQPDLHHRSALAEVARDGRCSAQHVAAGYVLLGPVVLVTCALDP